MRFVMGQDDIAGVGEETLQDLLLARAAKNKSFWSRAIGRKENISSILPQADIVHKKEHGLRTRGFSVLLP
jgi:hypothetical protein